MNSPSIDAAKLARINEQIRQEQITFDLRRKQEEKWFTLRMSVGYLAVFLIPLIFVVCSFVIYNHKDYPTEIVTLASTTLLVDIFGLVSAVWKMVLNPKSIVKTEPIISIDGM